MSQGSMSGGEKAAGVGIVATWGGWLVAHLELLNGVLQTLLLTVSITTGVIAMIISWKKLRREREND